MFSFNLSDFTLVWLSLLYEALPFVALGSLLSGFVEVFVSREAVARFLPRNPVAATVVAAFAGVAVPMCECGIVPVVRRLIRKGVPAGAGVAYMLAAPIVHPLVIVSTLMAFRARGAVGVALLRVGIGTGIAVAVGLLTGWLLGDRGMLRGDLSDRPEHAGHEHSGETDPSGWRRFRAALRIAGDDFMTFSVFLIGGTAIAAFINSGFSRAAITPVAAMPVASVAGFMALAVLLNVCSEADAFIAAGFGSFSLPARLSFIILGPMFDIKLLVMYGTVFRRRGVALLVFLIVGAVFAVCVSGAVWMDRFVELFPK